MQESEMHKTKFGENCDSKQKCKVDKCNSEPPEGCDAEMQKVKYRSAHMRAYIYIIHTCILSCGEDLMQAVQCSCSDEGRRKSLQVSDKKPKKIKIESPKNSTKKTKKRKKKMMLAKTHLCTQRPQRQASTVGSRVDPRHLLPPAAAAALCLYREIELR